MKTNVITLLAGILLLTILSCSSKSSNNYNNPTTTGGGGGTVTPVANASATIQNFAFSPATIYLKPGGTVMWTNKDATPHTVTDNGGAFDSGTLSPDQTFSYTFPNTAGTYTYHCTIHSMMASAKVVVGN